MLTLQFLPRFIPQDEDGLVHRSTFAAEVEIKMQLVHCFKSHTYNTNGGSLGGPGMDPGVDPRVNPGVRTCR